MNRRIIIIIIAAAGILLLGTLLVLLVAWRQKPPITTVVTNTIQTNTATTTANTNETNTVDVTTDTASPAVLNDEAALRRVINNFTERFGSYSTDTNYENIELARSLMTATMAKTADNIISQNSQKADTFYSIETTVMTTTLTDYSADATGATAEVNARQTIIEGQANPSYRNQTARLTLVKVADTWKVDSFRWQ